MGGDRVGEDGREGGMGMEGDRGGWGTSGKGGKEEEEYEGRGMGVDGDVTKLHKYRELYRMT